MLSKQNAMYRTIYLLGCWMAGLLLGSSCQNGSIDHIGGVRVVLLEKIPIIENRFDEDFKATLEMLYPFQCHDTTFIQDQVFLERIDLKVPYKREFSIPPSLMRDFFGSNNPDKKKALREEQFYIGDSCFELSPDKQFLTDSEISVADQSKAIGNYLSRNRKNSLVYLVSNDTLLKKQVIGGVARTVHHDLAKLNCMIVSELRKKAREELIRTMVVLIVIPRETGDTSSIVAITDTTAPRATRKLASGIIKHRAGGPCPSDTEVNNANKHHSAIIREFRNLLHYIATTSSDASLKSTYQADAYMEIHKIPGVRIEGIPDNDLRKFLSSGFSPSVSVVPVYDDCRMIAGIRIDGWK